MMVFKVVKPRKTVEVFLPDGKVVRGPRNAMVRDFINQAYTGEIPVVGAIVNDELRELTYPIQMDARVIPITMADPDGARIYRRSLTFLLDTAFNELFPEGTLTIDHSVASGGYYCQVSGIPPLSKEQIERLESRMHELVRADLPFQRSEVPLDEAIEYFKQIKAEDTVKLLSHRTKKFLKLYQLRNHRDYHHGYMVPSTGFLKWFKLILTNGGFTLRFPNKNDPITIKPLQEYPKLLKTFRQYGDWLQRLGISNVGSLNDAIEKGRIREVILVSEALHDQHVNEIAKLIVNRSKNIKAILIAGPTSSGKTTFSKRLSITLLAQGINPFPLEMDNYFLDREKTPLDENGRLDFENLAALDTNLLAQNIYQLSNGEEVQLPHYNFRTGKREPGEIIRLLSGEILLIEGIHGLNPNLIPNYPLDKVFRIYVSALTQLNLDRHNRVSTTDSRLIRRITRDARERGYSALTTIQRWESVRRGEKNNIFPYQENADVMFNSALVYELSALKPIVDPLLLQVPFGTPEYIEAKRLLSFLEWFIPIDNDLIPSNSILREFIGGSILKNFKLWEHSL